MTTFPAPITVLCVAAVGKGADRALSAPMIERPKGTGGRADFHSISCWFCRAAILACDLGWEANEAQASRGDKERLYISIGAGGHYLAPCCGLFDKAVWGRTKYFKGETWLMIAEGRAFGGFAVRAAAV